MDRFLLIVRTPLQAKVAQFALEAEGDPVYDLLFFTRQKSLKNLHSFESLGKGAQRKFLVFVPSGFRWFLSELLFYALGRAILGMWRESYATVVFGSLDSPPLAALATHFRSRLVTVDDGSANIFPRSSYFQEQTGMRLATLQRLTRSPNLQKIVEMVDKHYTIFPGYENVIETKKLVPVPNWPAVRNADTNTSPTVVFISTAEHQFMSSSELGIFQKYIAALNIDYKISHPMDEKLSFNQIPELPHAELLAEEALGNVSPNFSIHLVGAVSTVMITASKLAARRTVILFERDRHLGPLFEAVGCEIVSLSSSS